MDLPSHFTSAARRVTPRCLRLRTSGEETPILSDSSSVSFPVLFPRDNTSSLIHSRQIRSRASPLLSQKSSSSFRDGQLTSRPLFPLHNHQALPVFPAGQRSSKTVCLSERISLDNVTSFSSLENVHLPDRHLLRFSSAIRDRRNLSRGYHSTPSSSSSSGSGGTLEEGLASPEAVNILRGVPSYHLKEKDKTKNYLELDPDNPSRLLEHFSDLLRRGNLEPNDAQKALMQKLQALLDDIEAFDLQSGDPFDPMTAQPPPSFSSRPDSPGLLSPSSSRITTEEASSASPCNGGFLSKLFGGFRGGGGGNSNSNRRKENFPRSNSSLIPPLHSLGVSSGSEGGVMRSDDSFSPRQSLLRPPPPIRGLYIYGGVGQGKTMIMDAFFDCLHIKNKLRLHFHQFMQEVQEKLHRVKAERRYEDPLFEVSKQIRSQAQVLCFDEFQVTNIADAMILKRLFEALFSYGAIVVATSNRPPSELYAGGLNRDRFLPFIDLLLDCCEVFHIETRKDYRLSKLTASSHGLYFVPPREEEEILKQFKYLLQDNSLSPGPGSIQVSMGRDLQVPWMSGGFAQFSFEDLCMRSVGPSDFLAIAQHFHTVFLSTIPDLHDKMDDYPNEIRRFISLIDILYEKHTRVIFDAAAPPFRLLGIPPSVEHFELLRQSIQNQFHTLQDFLNALKPFCLEKAASSSSSFPSDMINEENWRKGTRQLLNLPNEVASDIFQKLQKSQNASDFLPLDVFRSSLFFHMQNFDEEQPTEKNEFLFSKAEDLSGKKKDRMSQPVSTPYELFNEGGSSGAQDNKFAYIRTISRIRDMASTSYLEAHQKQHKLNDLKFFGVC